MENIVCRKYEDKDIPEIISIFNYYSLNTLANYMPVAMSEEQFPHFKAVSKNDSIYVMENVNKEVVGFGLLKNYFAGPCFAKTVDAGYFLRQDYTGVGLGKKFLDYLIERAKEMGMTQMVANVSSQNPHSIAFHKKNGFELCGTLKDVGEKFGEKFDIVWFQKTI